MIKHTLYTVSLAAIIAPAMGAEWQTDFEAAKQQAAAENKAVLLNFTGSDWCGYCIRMKAAVLDTPEFAEYVKDRFVLVEVDLPRRNVLSAEEIEKRQELCREYEVRGFPTFLVVDATGEVLDGFTGGRPDFESMKPYLHNGLARRHMLAEARKLAGLDRANALMQIYRDFPKNFAKAAAALRMEIAAHDPQDTTGLQRQAEADAQMQALYKEVAACGRDYQAMTKVFDAYIAKALPANKERIMERKRSAVVFPCLNVMLLNANTVEDIIAARQYVLKEADTCYPESIREEMKAALRKEFDNPEQLLQKIRDKRK